MNCIKCGAKLIRDKCPYCEEELFIKEKNKEEEPENADVIKMLGLFSIAVPILAIVALIMGKGYNKANNYGNSEDMRIGITCSKVVLWTYGIMVIGITLFYLIGLGFIFGLAGLLT